MFIKRNRFIVDTEAALEKYADMVYRIAVVQMKNKADAEDVFQEVFLRLVTNKHKIESEEHLKSWLIRVTINCCRKQFSSGYRKRTVSMEEDTKEMSYEMETESGLWEEVKNIPEKYSEVIYLYYYEGYLVKEISEMLNRSENTVKSQLKRGREILRGRLEEE